MIQISNSAVTANKNAKEYPAFACYREIGIAAVAAALCCEHMPVPNDERAAKYVREPSWSDRLA
jgi:hypothetical protein